MTVNPPAEDANIALVDIVRYSDLPGRDQLRAIQKLTQIVRSTKTLAETPENRVFSFRPMTAWLSDFSVSPNDR
jgi:hypothetical protein